MLAAWAKSHPEKSVREEETIKDAASRMHRRADVMATLTTTGTKVAFEVEYKPFSPEEWAAKHAEYLALGIIPVCVFGHTHRYLDLTNRPSSSGTVPDRCTRRRRRRIRAATPGTLRRRLAVPPESGACFPSPRRGERLRCLGTRSP